MRFTSSFVLIASFITLAGAPACSSSSSDAPATHVDGTVSGYGLAKVSASAFTRTTLDVLGGSRPGLELRVATHAPSCAAGVLANVTELDFQLEGDTGATSIAPGTYSIASAQVKTNASAMLVLTNASCAMQELSPPVGGNLTLTKVDGANVEGTFSVKFETGDTLTGAIAAPVCAPGDAASGPSTVFGPMPACAP